MLGTPMNKKKFLENKGLKHGDMVSFRVENQRSGGWRYPLAGTLNMDADEPYINVIHNGNSRIVTINHGYDAYIGSIERIEEKLYEVISKVA